MIDDLIIEGVYIIHALHGYEYHEKRIVALFDKIGLEYEFVTDGDPVYFNQQVLEKYFVPGIETRFSQGGLSCTLNHIHAYEKIVQRGIRYAVIFENDPFFLGDFKKKLKRMSAEIESLEKGFIVSLENSTLRFPSYWNTKRKKYLYQATEGRMAGAYLIDLAGATKILEDLQKNKCHHIIDWWHNRLIQRGIIKMYWAHPPLVEQGSHNGYLSSTISSKPSSIKRRIKWLVQKNCKMYVRRFLAEKCIVVKSNK